MTYAHPEYLTSTQGLADAIDAGDETLRIFDATVNLVPNPPGYKAVSGRDDFDKGHIPGANFMDLPRDYADRDSKFNFMMPSDDALKAAYQAAGIDSDSRVVLYCSGHMMWATRAWWMLYSTGHKNVSVLDGGLAKWAAEDRLITAETHPHSKGNFIPSRNHERWADKDKVLGVIEDGDTCTINALSPGVYSGSADMHYGRKGHITNSINIFYDTVMDRGCFRSAQDLQKIFADKGVLDKPQTIAYCGGGISATIDALALALIGYESVAVYDGSMGEWASDETLPLVEGEA
jgi:thiosulfate/3-mercaptopyruvate sulfurtransferase